ncbi:MAG: hypothetical protein PHX60_05640 [Giesbergeria sp.]|uniref:hypothetical protein n=1 Tax=Giesbergeria sp. TaxID=2818473 RepID=UPI0026082C5F|nr:hypothetical protein [Giesbergeria sp.]MDD2609164.1 hypothetical protein [Giesbergeria sp.]
MPLPVRTFFALTASFLPLLAAAQVAEMPAPEAFKPGDQWVWRQIDNRTKLEEGKPTRTVVLNDGILNFSYGNSQTKILDGLIGRPATQQWRQWPLEVGKKWTHNEDWRRADGVTGNTQAQVEVTAYEEVDVPAGKFMAFKIEHKGFFNNSRGNRGQQIDTFWYAPEALADVKLIRNDGYNMYTRELMSYKRGTP